MVELVEVLLTKKCALLRLQTSNRVGQEPIIAS